MCTVALIIRVIIRDYYLTYILHSVSNQTNLFFPNVLKKEGFIALSTLEKKKMF